MKAFAINKLNKEKYNKEEQMKIKELNTQLSIINGEEFFYVEIGNPLKSNCIYEIDNINLKLKNKNKLSLSIGDGVLKRSIAKALETNIIWEQIEDKSIEILSSSMNKEELINILDNYSIILLPGGSIFLKTMKPIDEIILNIKWREELF